MPHTFVPVHIRPHLVSFLFREFKPEKCTIEGAEITVAKLSTKSPVGKTIRLYMEKTYKKPVCDTTPLIYLKVEEHLKKTGIYKYPDGRSSYLFLPKEGQEYLNDHLEGLFETALMYSIYSWHKSNSDQGINDAIVSFLTEFNLEEYNYTILGIRRDYYRKRKAGYFENKVAYNPFNGKVETL
jgi:hypothetical protein